MAIFQSKEKFAGSNIEQTSMFAYIKPEVRQLKFDKKTNVEGLYVLFLPAYKEDGAWFKAFHVRNNFGVGDIKKTYYVEDTVTDPASYFEKSFKARFPDQAKPIKPGEGRNTTKFTIYPAYGHVVQRVAFNVGTLKELREQQPIEKVLHILDVPAYKGADSLTKWMATPQPDGTPSPLISDHTAAVAVYVKMVSDVGKDGGWTLSPNIAHRYAVPDVYADADNLYNLEDIFIKKSNEEIISDLRSFYNSDIFNTCMDGFPGFRPSATSYPSTSLPPAPLDDDQIPGLPVAQLPITALPPPPGPTVTQLPPPPVAVTPTAAAIQPLAPPAPTQLPSNPVIAGPDSVVVQGKAVKTSDLRSFLEAKEPK